MTPVSDLVTQPAGLEQVDVVVVHPQVRHGARRRALGRRPVADGEGIGGVAFREAIAHPGDCLDKAAVEGVERFLGEGVNVELRARQRLILDLVAEHGGRAAKALDQLSCG
jgi:hypothetical protein